MTHARTLTNQQESAFQPLTLALINQIRCNQYTNSKLYIKADPVLGELSSYPSLVCDLLTTALNHNQHITFVVLENVQPSVSTLFVTALSATKKVSGLGLRKMTADSVRAILPLLTSIDVKIRDLYLAELTKEAMTTVESILTHQDNQVHHLYLDKLKPEAVSIFQSVFENQHNKVNFIRLRNIEAETINALQPALTATQSKIKGLGVCGGLSPEAINALTPIYSDINNTIRELGICWDISPEAIEKLRPIVTNTNSKLTVLTLQSLTLATATGLNAILTDKNCHLKTLRLYHLSSEVHTALQPAIAALFLHLQQRVNQSAITGIHTIKLNNSGQKRQIETDDSTTAPNKKQKVMTEDERNAAKCLASISMMQPEQPSAATQSFSFLKQQVLLFKEQAMTRALSTLSASVISPTEIVQDTMKLNVQ